MDSSVVTVMLNHHITLFNGLLVLSSLYHIAYRVVNAIKKQGDVFFPFRLLKKCREYSILYDKYQTKKHRRPL